jgi:endonuclease/exonuclease/phosphatase family metal-dependent hydrolase
MNLAPTDDELHVMTFNLRFASDEPPHSWPERRPVVARLLARERPHLVGTQEGLHAQLGDMEADLPAYFDRIGQAREGGTRGEAMAIFYDSRRLRPLEHHDYWLSDTPDVVGSRTWGRCPRMVTWVRFEDRRTGHQLYALNTHLEAFDPTARRKSADLVVERMAAELDPALPVLMTGDFNEPAGPGGTVYDALVTDGPMVDTWVTATERSDAVGTFHGYAPPTPGGDRIDWILTSPEVVTRQVVVNTYQHDGQSPSDHLPVQAVVSLPPAS